MLSRTGRRYTMHQINGAKIAVVFALTVPPLRSTCPASCFVPAVRRVRQSRLSIDVECVYKHVGMEGWLPSPYCVDGASGANKACLESEQMFAGPVPISATCSLKP